MGEGQQVLHQQREGHDVFLKQRETDCGRMLEAVTRLEDGQQNLQQAAARLEESQQSLYRKEEADKRTAEVEGSLRSLLDAQIQALEARLSAELCAVAVEAAENRLTPAGLEGDIERLIAPVREQLASMVDLETRLVSKLEVRTSESSGAVEMRVDAN